MAAIKFVDRYLCKIRDQIVASMNECTTESGCMKNEHKYRHAILAQKLDAFDTVIEFIK